MKENVNFKIDCKSDCNQLRPKSNERSKRRTRNLIVGRTAEMENGICGIARGDDRDFIYLEKEWGQSSQRGEA